MRKETLLTKTCSLRSPAQNAAKPIQLRLLLFSFLSFLATLFGIRCRLPLPCGPQTNPFYSLTLYQTLQMLQCTKNPFVSEMKDFCKFFCGRLHTVKLKRIHLRRKSNFLVYNVPNKAISSYNRII